MIVHAPLQPRQQRVAEFFRTLLRFFVRTKRLGLVVGPESRLHVGTGRRLAAEASFIPQERLSNLPSTRSYEAAPDLMVEVRLAARGEDWNKWRPIYRQAGVREIWWIDPEETTVVVKRLQGSYYRTTTIREGRVRSKVLPGFWVDTSWLWSDPLPEGLKCLREILE